MKRIVLIAAAGLLLAGCQSKREICAKWAAKQINTTDAMKALGLKGPERSGSGNTVGNYCRYYRD